MTAVQQDYIRRELTAARDDAVNALIMTEKSAFFKKHKIKIEAYLTEQGYDVKKSYEVFVAKQKAEMKAKGGSEKASPEPELD